MKNEKQTKKNQNEVPQNELIKQRQEIIDAYNKKTLDSPIIGLFQQNFVLAFANFCHDKRVRLLLDLFLKACYDSSEIQDPTEYYSAVMAQLSISLNNVSELSNDEKLEFLIPSSNNAKLLE